MTNVYEGKTDARQSDDVALPVSRFRPRYRALTDEEKAYATAYITNEDRKEGGGPFVDIPQKPKQTTDWLKVTCQSCLETEMLFRKGILK